MTTFTSVTDNVAYVKASDINQYGTLFQEIPGPDGWMENGTLSVTVASSNLTVALKTKAGANPSASDPVTVWINGTKRQCTAALSVTKNAGTNWFNAGSAELATKEIDYFAYLIWNTTPATDIMDIGIARIPYGRLYSDFSGTTTNEKYLAFGNASTPTSTNDVVNIGRFAATLSAGAGYTWSVPTFTNKNLRNEPCFETSWLTYTPVFTGFSADPTNTVYRYKVSREDVTVRSRQSTSGTSNATTFTMTAPFTAATITNGVWGTVGVPSVDNGAVGTTPALAQIGSGSPTINIYKNTDVGTTAWTNANGKRIGYFELSYPLE